MTRARRTIALVALLALGCDEDPVTRDGRDGGAAFDAGAFDAGGAGEDAGLRVDAGGGLDAGDPDPDAGPPPDPCPRARVTTMAGETLNVRPAPNTSMAPVGSLPSGYIVDVVAMVTGETIGGVSEWLEIRSPLGDGYVFSTFVECTTDERPADDGAYYLPFTCGAGVRVTQGNGGSTSHTGRTQYAFDFGVGLNTPIRAMRAGTVTGVRTDTRPGDACYGGGGSSCGPYANWVIVQHADRTTSAYKHLNSSEMTVGRAVARGDVIGLSGSTGYSTGPHLHLELRGDCPTEIYCQTIPLQFAEAGVPSSGATVTSGNCP